MKRVWLLVSLAIAMLGLAAIARGQSGGLGPPPDPNSKNDGCQRSYAGIVSETSPEWVYVNRDPSPKLVTGVVSDSHMSHEDFSLSHFSYDWVSNVTPDPAYRNLLAGDPTAKTGNFRAGEDEPAGVLHVERESGSFPFFAWPSDGDRVSLWGSWIWDCGHWTPTAISPPRAPGQPGEKTEIHPVRAIVVTRRNGFLDRNGATQADAFISSEGTKAHAEEKCALQHAPVDDQHYDSGFGPCKNDPANRVDPVNDTDYTFFVPAPAHKPAGSKLQYRVLRRQADNAPPVRVQFQQSPPGIQVTIPFKSAGGAPNGSFARTFFVSWSKPPARKPQHLAVKIESYKSLKALDPHPGHGAETSKPPDEDVATVDVNGIWQLLDRWAPKMLAIKKGQTVKINRTIKLYATSRLRLTVNGIDCDLTNAIAPCPARPGETGLLNDALGEKTQTFSLRRAPGRHRIRSPEGTYLLTYSVKRIR